MKLVIFFIFSSMYSFAYSATNFEVKSTPSDSFVYFQEKPSSKPIKLGKTPLKLSSGDIEKLVGENKTYILNVRKKGFDPYQILMVRTKGVDTSLEVTLDINKEIKTAQKHDNLASALFDVQRLIRSNNFSDALKQLDNLEKEYEGFSIISEMKGLTYYMKKDINNALAMFRLAFSKNPENRDAYKMKVYLEKKLGIDTEVN